MSNRNYKCLGFPAGTEVPSEYDDYAFLQSSVFQSIFDNKKLDSGIYKGAGFLKISKGKKSLYLKYRQYCRASKHVVVLTYANRCLLGLDPKLNAETSSDASDQHQDSFVTIRKASWFVYNWNNRNLTERWNFRALVIGFAALLIIDIPQFVIAITQLFN